MNNPVKYICLIVVFFILAATHTAKSQVVIFKVKESYNTYIMGISDSNFVAGYFDDATGIHGFIYTIDDTLIINHQYAVQTFLYDINKAGMAVGVYNTTGNQNDNIPFFYDKQTHNFIDFPYTFPAGSFQIKVFKINDWGDVAGNYRLTTKAYGFYSTGGVFTSSLNHHINLITEAPTYITGMNDQGRLTGYYINVSKYIGTAYNCDLGVWWDYQIGNYRTKLNGINNKDIMVGEYNNIYGFMRNIWADPNSPNQFITIPGALEVHPFDINDTNQIVGYMKDATNAMVGFIIRGYDNKFRPYLDGWSKPNSRDVMWDPNWYHRFNYQIDPYKQGGKFPKIKKYGRIGTVGSSIFPDWPLWVSVFGEGYCYTKSKNQLHLRYFSFQKWVNYFMSQEELDVDQNRVVQGRWKGSCYGMTASSIMIYNNKDEFHSYFPESGPFFSSLRGYFYPLSFNNIMIINRIQTMQRLPWFIDNLYTQLNSSNMINTLSTLKQIFIDGEKNERVLGMVNQKNPTKGHAMVPFKILQDTFDLNVENIYVYDPNFPRDTTRRIAVNTTTGIWSYKTNTTAGVNTLEWGGETAKNCFLMPSSEEVYSQVHGQTLKSPAKPALSLPLLCYSKPVNELLITNTSGQSIGTIGDSIVNQIAGAYPVTDLLSDSSFYPAFALPAGDYQISVSGVPDSLIHLSMENEGTIYTFNRYDALAGQTDRLAFNGGWQIHNPDSANKLIDMQGIVSQDALERMMKVSRCGLAFEDSLDFHFSGYQDLSLLNKGVPKYYDLNIRQISDSGESVFQHDSIPFWGHVSHQVHPDWEHLATGVLKIYVDSLMDGTVDDTLFFNNQAMPVLAVSSYQIKFPVTGETDTLYIDNQGGGVLNWAVSTPYSWTTLPGDTVGVNYDTLFVRTLPNTGGYRLASVLIQAPGAENPSDTLWIAQDGIIEAPVARASDGTFPDKIVVSVSPVSGATHYQFYRASTVPGTDTVLTAWIQDTVFEDTAVIGGQAYYYRVSAAMNNAGLNASGRGSYDQGWSEAGPTGPVTGAVSGTLCYANTMKTKLPQVTVRLMKDGVMISTDTTDVTGHFSFQNLVAGNYSLEFQTSATYGGINSIDGLQILKHFTQVSPLSGLYFQAGDVNMDNAVNSIDALLVVKRFVNLISSFNSPDWIFEGTNFVIEENSNLTIEVRGICAGDVNGSYTP